MGDIEPQAAGTRVHIRNAVVGLVLLLFGVYGLSAGGHTYSSDEEGMLLTTRTILIDRTPILVVDEDKTGLIPAVAGRVDGKPVGVSGLAQSAVMAPFLGIGELAALTVADEWGDYTIRLFVGLTNPLVTAAGVALFFLICVELGAARRSAIALSLVYALGTYAWPHAKTMFSEPITATLLLAAALFAVRYGRRRGSASLRDAALVGAFAALALFGRATSGLMIPLVCAYVAWSAWVRGRFTGVVKAGAATAAGAALPLVLFGATNWWRFGSPFDLGYQQVPLDFPIVDGLYGLLLSPGKSVFLYAPAVAVGIAAAVLAPRERRREAALFLSMAFVNVVFFARFVHWHGDHSWGPRYLLLSVPFFLLPAAALVDRVAWRRAVAVAGALGFVSALLGTAMYFNQYFAVAEQAIGLEMAPDGPTYWREMHFEPSWSPIVGHARLLDDVAANGVDGIQGDLPEKPMARSTRDRYGYYFGPPSPDSWVWWNAAFRGPRRLFLLAPVLLAIGISGAGSVRRALRDEPA